MFYHKTFLVLILSLGGCSLIVDGSKYTGGALDGSTAPLDGSPEDTGTILPMDAGEPLRDATADTLRPLDSGANDSGARDSGEADTGSDPCASALRMDAGSLGYCRVVPVDWRAFCPAECVTVGCWGVTRDAGSGGALVRCE